MKEVGKKGTRHGKGKMARKEEEEEEEEGICECARFHANVNEYSSWHPGPVLTYGLQVPVNLSQPERQIDR